MRIITSILVAIISISALLSGVALSLCGVRSVITGSAADAILFLCGIVCLGIYAIISMLDGIASEIQKSRAASSALAGKLDYIGEILNMYMVQPSLSDSEDAKENGD